MQDLVNEPYFTRMDADRIKNLLMGSKGVVAHNFEYDRNVLQDQFWRVGKSRLLGDSKVLLKHFCTQSETYKAGYSSNANVSLAQAVKSVLGIDGY